jgi:hypothetical protein
MKHAMKSHGKKMGMANGGKVKAMPKETAMKKVAKGEVAKHEKEMHGKKMANGGYAKKKAC